jgi:hypothetical protein
MYFQTELFATANREGGTLSQIRNCDNWTIKRKIGYIFVARTRKMKCKVRENVKLREHEVHLSLTSLWQLGWDHAKTA